RSSSSMDGPVDQQTFVFAGLTASSGFEAVARDRARLDGELRADSHGFRSFPRRLRRFAHGFCREPSRPTSRFTLRFWLALWTARLSGARGTIWRRPAKACPTRA